MNSLGLPTSISGAYVIGEVDQEVQGRVVRRLGKPYGVWLDDTTPDLDKIWYPAAKAKYLPLGLHVLRCIAPGERGLHLMQESPLIVPVKEVYIYGMEAPPEAYLPVPNGYPSVCQQWDWEGTQGHAAPTQWQRDRLTLAISECTPKPHIWWRF